MIPLLLCPFQEWCDHSFEENSLTKECLILRLEMAKCFQRKFSNGWQCIFTISLLSSRGKGPRPSFDQLEPPSLNDVLCLV